MLENLTSRERILALVVGALVPIAILFMGVFWFIGKYSANNTQAISLASQVQDEKDKTDLAIRASQRRRYYREISLPANAGVAANEYQSWLKDLVRNELDMDFRSVTPQRGNELKFDNQLVAETRKLTLLATADLKQLTKFLHKFYSVDLLHRINSIKIVPLTKSAGSEKKIRSGKLSLSINIEVVSMVDADVDRDFTQSLRELNRPLAEYEQAILRRNLFGPANNSPTVSARPSSSYAAGSEFKVNVTGDDADQDDQLTFELLESPIEGAKLVTDEKGRKAALEVPEQVAGQYEFKIGVSDNGFPSKQNETLVKVTVKDRVVAAPKDPPLPKPKFKHINQTHVTGIVKDVADNWMVWIKVRTTGESYQLKSGETFELDDQTWTVEAVKFDEATLKVDNRLLTFRPADSLSSPRSEKLLK